MSPPLILSLFLSLGPNCVSLILRRQIFERRNDHLSIRNRDYSNLRNLESPTSTAYHIRGAKFLSGI